MRIEHKNQIESAVQAVREHENIKNIYFVACGGSQAVLMSGQYIFDKETDLPAQVYTANEFIHETPKSVGSDSLVISCSHSGDTPETVKATKLARELGALTIALSHEVGSPLWEEAEYPVHYDWGPEVDDSDKNKGILYGLLFSLLDVFEPNPKWQVCFEALSSLTDLSNETKKIYEEKATQWAKNLKRDELIYTMGSGLNYGEVYSTALCWFMEMQWIQSCPIHTGEYFHGPFEITDYDVPFLLVKSIGKTRFLDERAEKFAVKFSEKVEVLDQADLPLDSVSEDAKQYIAAILSGVAIRHYVEKISFERGHKLDVRRYMWQMEY